MNQLSENIINALHNCLPVNQETIALHAPCFWGKERDYVLDCLESGWVSSVGKYVDRFEDMLVDYTGAKKAVATVNGTAALHTCLKIIGVQPGDEVMVPALTFVATANAVSHCGAIPHFIDSEVRTLGLDPSKLGDYLAEHTEMRDGQCFNRQTGRPVRAVVVKCLAWAASVWSLVKIAPPPPVVIVLLPLKLKIDILPQLPVCRP